jgi:hypothetical protein
LSCWVERNVFQGRCPKNGVFVDSHQELSIVDGRQRAWTRWSQRVVKKW